MGKKDMEAMQAKIEAGEARDAKKKAKEMHDKVKKKGVGFLADFKKFITRGNVVDMAVAVIVGGAFTAIVNSVSNQVLKPLINFLMAVATVGHYAYLAEISVRNPVPEYQGLVPGQQLPSERVPGFL